MCVGATNGPHGKVCRLPLVVGGGGNGWLVGRGSMEGGGLFVRGGRRVQALAPSLSLCVGKSTLDCVAS